MKNTIKVLCLSLLFAMGVSYASEKDDSDHQKDGDIEQAVKKMAASVERYITYERENLVRYPSKSKRSSMVIRPGKMAPAIPSSEDFLNADLSNQDQLNSSIKLSNAQPFQDTPEQGPEEKTA